ncbi:hypothetical protein VB005_02910 [Metarhizium brunneum]
MPYSPAWTDDEKLHFWKEVIPAVFDDSDPPVKILGWREIAEKMTKKFPNGRTYSARSLSERYHDKKNEFRSRYEGKALAKKVVESLQGEDSGATKEQ